MVSFRIPGQADEAICLDDACKWREMGCTTIQQTTRRRGKGLTIIVRCSIEDAEKIAAELEDRGANWGSEGWDQPPALTRACRLAATRVRAAIAAVQEEAPR